MNPWTVKEVSILRRVFPISLTKDVARALPKRTLQAIADKSKRLGLRKTVNYMASKCVP